MKSNQEDVTKNNHKDFTLRDEIIFYIVLLTSYILLSLALLFMIAVAVIGLSPFFDSLYNFFQGCR